MGIHHGELHLGTTDDDPNGIADCTTCHGTAVVDAQPCPDCHQRQQLRNAFWAAGPGPARLQRLIRDL